MKRAVLREVSFSGMTKEEINSLSSLPIELKNSIGNVVSSFRAKGKQISVKDAASQMMQIPAFKNNPHLASFLNTNLAQSNNPEAIASALNAPKNSGDNIPLPANFSQQRLIPQSSNPKDIANALSVPGRKSVELPTNFNNQPNLKTATQNQAAPQQKYKSYEQQLADRKARKNKVSESVIKEFLGQGQGANVQRIFKSLQGLSQQDLVALQRMLNGLISTQRGTTSMTSMTTRENKSVLSEVLKIKIKEQIVVRNKINSILSEGIGDNIWGKIKDAGTAIGQKIGLTGRMGQQANAVGAQQQETQVAQQLQKMIAKVNQHRQKFNSSILKNSQTLDAYHNLVVGLVDAYKQSQNAIGPAGPQLSRQIQDAVGNFVYDLKSEKEQIDMFLNQLKDAGMAKVGGSAMIKSGDQTTMDPTVLGAAAKKRAESARLADSDNAGITSYRRAAPGGHLGPEDLEKTKQSILARAKNAKTEKERTKAMDDLQNLFMRQINRQKSSKKKTPTKKSSKNK
jgi:hypothetical protein